MRLASAPAFGFLIVSIHCGVRTYCVTSHSISASAHTIWMPLEPLPTTAIRLPRTSRPSGHSEEWNCGPTKVSMPSMRGMRLRCRKPVAATTASAVWVAPVLVVTTHRPSTHSADVTSTPKVMYLRRSSSSAMRTRYDWISSPGA